MIHLVYVKENISIKYYKFLEKVFRLIEVMQIYEIDILLFEIFECCIFI